MRSVVKGNIVDIDAGLAKITDWNLVKSVRDSFFCPHSLTLTIFLSIQYYKLATDAVISSLSSNPGRASKEKEVINELVVSAVAMKSVMS